MQNNTARGAVQFFAGGGEMGRLIREKDWSITPLGPFTAWPQSLVTALSIVINSKFPMFIWWGRDLTCFYNDAYRPSLGQNGKHPSILGMKAEDAWAEIWHIIKPLIDQVLAGGEATWSEDQLIPIYRNGKLEDVYWTFSYSPIINESGKPGGVLVTCNETTQKVLTYIKLEESKNELEFAIDATGLGTWDYNPLTNKFSSNQRLKQWFGLERDGQVELSHAISSMLESDRERVTGAITKALDFSSGGNYDIEYTIVHPVTQKQTIVHAKGRAWFNENKVPYRFNGTMEDITEQAVASKKIRASEQKFQAAVQAVSGIVWTNNAHGEMVGEQKAWAELTGQAYGEYQGYGWANAVHPNDAQATVKAWTEAVNDVKTFIFEHRVKTKDGTWRDFAVRAIPLLDSDGILQEWVGVHIDITERKLAEAKLRESVDRYHYLITSSPSAIGILTTEKLIITTANQAIIDIWGKGWQIMGRSYFEALPELAQQGYGDIFNQVYKTGVPFNAIETPVQIVQNGKMQLKYYNFLLYPQRDLNGDIDGIGIMATEVTTQALFNRQIQESEKKFRLLADSMPQHVWTADAEGNLNYFNQSVYDYSGLTAEQVNADGWLQIVHPGDREMNIKEWAQSIQSGKDFLLEHRFRKHTGEYRWQLSRAVPQKDENGKIRMWVGTSTDIEEQKTFAAELEKQVAARTKELAENNIELEKMNKELQSFAYISSHDLQEPLRKIQTFASRIADKEGPNLSAAGKDHFKRMQESALRMQTLIDDLLAYSRSNTADRQFEKVHLEKIIAEVKDDLKEDLQQKGAIIETDNLCEVNIIPFQFRQLVQNLLTNSLKFADPLKPLHITIASITAIGADFNNNKLSPNTQYCRIRVADNGIGFEQKFSEKIFEVFQRLHGRSEYRGTGIGLAIVKKIAENHGGIVTATGELHKGATFDIYLPAA